VRAADFCGIERKKDNRSRNKNRKPTIAKQTNKKQETKK
jgi:hypothetical protein